MTLLIPQEKEASGARRTGLEVTEESIRWF